MKTVDFCDIGRSRYADAWTMQKQLWELRVNRSIGDTVLFTEHEHVYTLGKSADDNHLLAGDLELRTEGVDVHHIDRGGDITYHGPGQIVGYPIIDLNDHQPDLHRYLRNLEEVIIRTLADFGIAAGRDEGMTGVWVNGEKIAAIGVKVSRWITMHGFALNVSTDLRRFDRIIPCGIFHKGVTSMEVVLGRTVDRTKVRERLASQFSELFTMKENWIATGELLEKAESAAVHEREQE